MYPIFLLNQPVSFGPILFLIATAVAKISYNLRLKQVLKTQESQKFY